MSAGELGDVAVLDPPRARDVDGELRRHPARPAGQQHDAVAEADGLADVVGHEQDRRAGRLPDPLELVVEDVAGHGVERAEGLVHQQDLGLLREGPRQRHPLAHAARQLVGLAPREARSSWTISRSSSTRCCRRRLGHLAQPQRQVDVALHAQPREQRGLLEHERRVAAGTRRCPLVGRSRSATRLSSVDLPQPEAPRRHTNSPRPTDSEMSVERRDRVTAAREHLRHVIDPDGHPPGRADPGGGGVAVGCGGLAASVVRPSEPLDRGLALRLEHLVEQRQVVELRQVARVLEQADRLGVRGRLLERGRDRVGGEGEVLPGGGQERPCPASWT